MKLRSQVNGDAAPKKKPSILARIHPVADHATHRSWAIYGRSGSGKTTVSSTFPKPILLLDIKDKGTDSIADQKNISVIEIETWEDIEEIYYFLLENPTKYKTIVFDTVTQMQQLCMAKVSNKKKGRVGDWGAMTRQEFGEVSGAMKDWIVNFRDLPMEVVFLAQERVTTNEDEARDNMITPEVGPQLMPSVATALNAAVSVIGNTFIGMRTVTKQLKGGKKVEKEETTYCLRVGPSPVYVTKLRKPRSVEAPIYIENPTHTDIVQLMKGE